MAKLHVFGDSFSRGDGLIDPVLIKYHGVPHWTEYIKTSLKLEEYKNYAGQGWSNDEIFLSIIENLKDIGEGDYVIVGQTFLERTPFIIDDPKTTPRDEWLSRLGGVNLGVDQAYPENQNSRIQSNFFEKTFTYIGDVFVSTQAYIVGAKLKTPLWWQDYYKYRYDKLGEYLESKGVFYYHWDVSAEAPNYETIKTYTKGESQDDHWSWNGSYAFGKKLLRVIINKLKK